MLIGRFIFALGGENLSVTQSTFISKWFFGRTLAFALGSAISCARLGSVAAGWVLPAVYNIDNNLFIPLLFGCGACVISWVCSMVLGYIDYKADQ